MGKNKATALITIFLTFILFMILQPGDERLRRTPALLRAGLDTRGRLLSRLCRSAIQGRIAVRDPFQPPRPGIPGRASCTDLVRPVPRACGYRGKIPGFASRKPFRPALARQLL